MSEDILESYTYDDLPDPPPATFRIAEILPAEVSDPVTCLLHIVDWSNLPEYEALSYTWGDANARATIICEGKTLSVTQNLYGALEHLRHKDRSRFVYADALW